MAELTTPKQTKRYNYFRLIIVANFVTFALLLLLVINRPFLSIDLLITLSIQRINIPGFQSLMLFMTQLGNFELGLLATAIAAATVSVITKKWRDGLFVLLSTTGVFVISVFFKFLSQRPRPDADLINLIGKAATDPSFPSGHVLHYLGLYGFLLYLSYTKIRDHNLRYAAVAIFGSMILLVSLSRIYLGAHWFSDVLGSYLIGTVWLYFIAWIYRRSS